MRWMDECFIRHPPRVGPCTCQTVSSHTHDGVARWVNSYGTKPNVQVRYKVYPNALPEGDLTYSALKARPASSSTRLPGPDERPRKGGIAEVGGCVEATCT